MRFFPVLLGALLGTGIAIDAGRAAAQDAPAYKPPSRGAPASRVGGGSRGPGSAVPVVQVLAPDHTGLTLEAQPVLYWFIDRPVTSRVEVTVIDDNAVEPLLERQVDAPLAAGVQRIDLAALGVRLEPGIEYRWHVALVADAGKRSGDIVASGTIRRIAAPPDLAGRLAQTDAGGRYQALAAAGLWYDALAALSKRVEAQPEDGAARRLRAGLLREVGLAEVARFEAER